MAASHTRFQSLLSSCTRCHGRRTILSGGLLCLLPAPILAVAREHDSQWRLVIVIVAYIMAVKGMALVLSPYLFRKGTAFAAATDTRLRALCMAAVLAGVALVALGVLVF